MSEMQNIIARLGVIVVGAGLSFAGGYFLRLEMATPPAHAMHVYVFAGMIGIGCLVIIPDPIVDALKKLGVAVGPYLPWGKKDGGAP